MAMEKTDKSKYYIFIDECGNHNLAQAEIIMPEISIIVERRGKKEDNKLLNYYNGLRNRDTK